MAHGPQADPARAGRPRSSLMPDEDARDREPGGEVDALGQEIVGRLFRAGLDLHFALTLTADGRSANRLQHAVAELDRAIHDLRHLMLAVPGSAAGAAPDTGHPIRPPPVPGAT